MPKGGWLDVEHNFGLHSRQYLGHSFRYFLAKGFVQPGDRVIDAGCGVGYGTAILAQAGGAVAGFDVDERALEVANQRYKRDNTTFIQGNFNEITRLPGCDIAVSFETIEHIERDPQEFANLLKRCAGRTLIVSTPIGKTTHQNKYHVHDFTEQSFRQLFIDDQWLLWEFIRQGVYGILIAYRKDNGGPLSP